MSIFSWFNTGGTRIAHECEGRDNLRGMYTSSRFFVIVLGQASDTLLLFVSLYIKPLLKTGLH